MTKYEQLVQFVVAKRRAVIRNAVEMEVLRTGSTDPDHLHLTLGIARPALYRAMRELGYPVAEEEVGA